MTRKGSDRSGGDTSPQLDIRAPLVGGLAACVVFFAAGFGAAAVTRLDNGLTVPGRIVAAVPTQAIQHQRGGTIASVQVSEGQAVRAGDVLVTLDTLALSQQIAALKAQSEAAAKQLQLVRLEAETTNDLVQRKLAERSRVLSLQRQMAEVEKETAGFNARIAAAEQELEGATLRAPITGRVAKVNVAGPGLLAQPGQTLVEIAPEDDRLVIEGQLDPDQIEAVKPGQPAKVWLAGAVWRERKALQGRLVWVSPEAAEDKRTGAPYYPARIEIDGVRSDIAAKAPLRPGIRARILLVSSQATLFEQIVDPMVRSVARAFRS